MKVCVGLIVVQGETKAKKKVCRKRTVQMYFGLVHIENQEDKYVGSKRQKRPELHGPLLLTNNKQKEKTIGLLVERELNSRTTCKVSVVETTIHRKMTTVVRISTSGMI